MKYELVEVNKHFELQKGISYTSKDLVDESETGLLTINAFTAGGGFKLESEKPYGGDLKSDYLLSDGDVLLAMTEQDAGLLASPLTIKSDYSKFSNLTFSLDVARVISTSSEVDPNFLYNVLRIPAFRERAAYGDTGSTVQRLPYEAFGELKIPCPPLDVQRAIVQIIDDIDSKIYLNKQTSESLEQIAQTIFKSWFVDFDPVHAKVRGEQPDGMDVETAALFPDSFEDSELGPIPAGWSVGNLSNLVTLVKSTVKAGPATISKPYVPIDVIRSKSLFLHDVAPSDEAKTSLLSFERGDVLFGAMRPYFHKVCIAPFSGTTRSTNFVLRPKTHKAFSAVYLSLDETVDFATKHSQGSTIPYAVWANGLSEMAVVIPTTQAIYSFEELAGPMFELGEKLIRENNVLAGIRDSLLPRLISGELEIPEELLGE